MRWQLAGILTMLFVLLGGLAFAFLFLNASLEKSGPQEQDCVEVHKVASFIYDSCYDAYTKNVYLDVRRGADSYRVTELTLNFFDTIERTYVIKDVPGLGERGSFRIPASKNPASIDISLQIIKDFSAPICDVPRRIFVDYCPAGSSNRTAGAELNPLNGKSNSGTIQVGVPAVVVETDMLEMSLVEKEAIWRQQCQSDWDCSEWGPCIDGEQMRSCKDRSSCQISTNVQQTRRMCGESCVENWARCVWEPCSGGYTTPKDCVDLNECGTTYDTPQKLSCGKSPATPSCKPDVICGGWSSCSIDYNFLDLIGGSVLNLQGQRTRTCTDAALCISPVEEKASCTLSVDVYTQEYVRCGIEYRGIYDSLTNEQLAEMRLGTEENPALEITLGSTNQQYCSYCYDGIQNGDEIWVDCGPSCKSCTEMYGPAYAEVYQPGGLFVAPKLIGSLINLQPQSLFTKKFLQKAL